jgi:hypothetical protein
VLERVQRQLDVRRLRQLVPALHAHRDPLRSDAPPPGRGRFRSEKACCCSSRRQIWFEEIRDRTLFWGEAPEERNCCLWPPDWIWTITTTELGGTWKLYAGLTDGEWNSGLLFSFVYWIHTLARVLNAFCLDIWIFKKNTYSVPKCKPF